MKKQLLVLIVMAAVISQASASVRTIIKPEHIYQNMLARLLTDSVTLSDTATIFHLRILKRDERAVFFSHDTCLRDKKDRTYPLRQLISDDGLKPDEPTTFEDIGKNTLSIRFVFPPLSADVTEVDMIDPQFYNHGIFGIRLDGNPLPPFQLPKDVEVQLKDIMAVQDTLPKVDFRFGWATIKGHLMDYRPGMCSYHQRASDGLQAWYVQSDDTRITPSTLITTSNRRYALCPGITYGRLFLPIASSPHHTSLADI